ncbi:MAG: hypothetical protein K8T90_07195, partial [Planctomycetes bacterium]|nr:hypothetical protein [Planctomycetota bacterium]
MKPTRILAAVLGGILALTLAPAAFAAGGNVTVSVLATGVLNITGDSGDNQISITPNGMNSFIVTGLNGTTVNLTASATTTGVRSIRAFMGAGDDVVDVTGGRIRGDLSPLLSRPVSISHSPDVGGSRERAFAVSETCARGFRRLRWADSAVQSR